MRLGNKYFIFFFFFLHFYSAGMRPFFFFLSENCVKWHRMCVGLINKTCQTFSSLPSLQLHTQEPNWRFVSGYGHIIQYLY